MTALICSLQISLKEIIATSYVPSGCCGTIPALGYGWPGDIGLMPFEWVSQCKEFSSVKMNSRISVYSSAALTAIAMLAIMPTSAQAQASITATANVATALTVTAGNDLDFGLVIPGFTKTIAVTDATAGTFSMSGGAAAEVNFSFSSLPANLDDGLGNLLPISSYSGVHNTANDPVAGATAFTPSSGATTNLSGTGLLYIFVGGVADATGSPPNGTYTGTITLTAAYTGN